MSTISRRAFLKTVGVGALSVAAMSVLAGCDVKVPTETAPVTGAIEGAKGVSYKVSDTLTVAVNDTDVSVARAWLNAYADEYIKVINAGSPVAGQIARGSDAYDVASDTLKAEAADKAKKKADYVKTEELAVTVVVKNFGDDPILLGESGDSTKGYKFSGITVSGAEDVTFLTQVAPKNVVLANGETGNTLTVKAKVPCNAESYVLTIALPGAKAVKYTIKNKNNVKEIEPADFGTTANKSIGTTDYIQGTM